MVIGKSLLLRKSYERPSRLTHILGLYDGQKPRQRLSQLLSLSFYGLKAIHPKRRKYKGIIKTHIMNLTIPTASPTLSLTTRPSLAYSQDKIGLVSLPCRAGKG